MKILRTENENHFSNLGLIKLKDSDWIEKQRVAGKVTAATLSLLKNTIKEKSNISLLQLNQLAEEYIYDNECTPTFKNYHGFPHGVCISVNKELVHGIPSSYILQDGDVVKFDLGATYKKVIADSAITCIYGEAKSSIHIDIINSCLNSLYAGIKAIKVGKRLGVIGNAVYRHAKQSGFNVITKYGGHSLDYDIPHAYPFVPNKSEITDGPMLYSGMTLAIEPMLVQGDTYTKTLDDKWTVVTNDIGSHFEHSIFIHDDYVEIMTKREDEII